jgi:hypothetical protein
MNDDESPTAGLDAGEFHAMLQSRWALLAWEVAITALTVVMLRQQLGLATAAGVIDLAAVAQTLRVVKTRATGTAGDPVGRGRGRTSVVTGLGAAAAITLVAAVVAVVTVL